VTITDGKVGNQVFKGLNSGTATIDTADKIPVSPAKQYRIHAWVRKHHADAGAWMAMQWFDKDDAYISETGNDVTPSSTNVWEEFNFLSGDLPSGAAYVNCYFMTWGGGGSYSEFQDCRFEEIIPANLIVDGAIQAKLLTTDQVIAGCIEAGAIGADEIAANVIAAKHLIVADFSNIVSNHMFAGGSSEHWEKVNNATIVTKGTSGVPTGAYNAYVMKIGYGAYWAEKGYGTPTDFFHPCLGGDSFFVSAMWASDATSGKGTLYIGLNFKNKDGTDLGNLYLATRTGNSQPWTKHSGVITAPANSTQVRMLLVHDAGSAGFYYLSNPVVRRASNAELIVDGSITANHISTNGIVSPNYSAPTGSAAGVGLKIDAANGKIEAYGTGQALGANIVSQDADYMVSIGWKQIYTTYHYPPCNTSYFTPDGRIHIYRWSSPYWYEVATIGYDSSQGAASFFNATGMGGKSAVVGYSNGGGHGVVGTVDNGGAGVYGFSSGGYGVKAVASGIAALYITPTGSNDPPNWAAGIGALNVSGNGILWMNVTGGSGYSAWRAQGIIPGDYRGYALADWNQCCAYENDGYGYGYRIYTRIAGSWVVTWSNVPSN